MFYIGFYYTMDQLEAAGIVGSFEGGQAREVLLPNEYALEMHLERLLDGEISASPSRIDRNPIKEDKIKSTATVMGTQTPAELAVDYYKPRELPALEVQKKSSKNRWWIIIVVIIAVLWYWFLRG